MRLLLPFSSGFTSFLFHWYTIFQDNYAAFQLGDERFQLGDTVLLRNPDVESPPFVAEILGIYSPPQQPDQAVMKVWD